MPGSNEQTVVIKVVAGPHTGLAREYDRYAACFVGRGPEAHFCLDQDPHFSRRHLLFEVSPPRCRVVDLGSQNGTLLNGQPVESAELSNGDILTCGGTQISIELTASTHPHQSDETLPLPPPAATSAVTSCNTMIIGAAGGTPTISGYEIHDLLGSGTMGAVFRATEKASRRERALKVMVPERAVNDDDVRLFLREASVLGQLEHPRIVDFYELGWDSGQFFIAMELLRTESFESLVVGRPQAERTRLAAAITCGVLEALVFAHAKSIIHRDVKPGNLLLYRSGRKLKVKLADFGLAKNYLNAGMSGITGEGQTRGTLAFAAPEQIFDSVNAKPSCDIFSAGATLYHLITGKLPYDFPMGIVPIGMILTGDRIPLQERDSSIPNDLCAVVERAMQVEPDQRFFGAGEMREWLLPFTKRH